MQSDLESVIKLVFKTFGQFPTITLPVCVVRLQIRSMPAAPSVHTKDKFRSLQPYEKKVISLTYCSLQ